MEVLVIGGEEMTALVEALGDIPLEHSGVTITPILYKDNCHVGGIDKPHINGFFDFYTDGYRANGDESEGYLLTGEFDYKEINGHIKELLSTIFTLADTKVDLGRAIAESNRQRASRRLIQFGKTAVIPVVEAEEVYPGDRDWRALTQVG